MKKFEKLGLEKFDSVKMSNSQNLFGGDTEYTEGGIRRYEGAEAVISDWDEIIDGEVFLRTLQPIELAPTGEVGPS